MVELAGDWVPAARGENCGGNVLLAGSGDVEHTELEKTAAHSRSAAAS